LREVLIAEALGNWAASVDIVWIGMSLHHLQRSYDLGTKRARIAER
jgi:hypothetical protein